MKPIGVTVVAVNYHNSPAVRRLLESLVANVDSDWQLVVVDNSTSLVEAATLQTICGRDARARVVVAPSNLGYFGGARFGLAMLGGNAESWVVVANVDLRMDPNFIGVVRSRSEHGVLAPNIRSAVSGRNQNPYLLTRPSTWRVRVWQIQFAVPWVARLSIGAFYILARIRHSRFRDLEEPMTDSPVAIYAAHGSCIIFSREYFDRGGNLNHDAFLFGEEITVAEKCRDLGVEVLYDAQAVVLHEEHGSTGWWRSRQMLLWQRDSLKVVRDLLLGILPGNQSARFSALSSSRMIGADGA